ncbi:SusD family protein [Pedobacter sp. ok626]|uniref:RagB/SusD family nutrient uptake outer membrane protein n=1 Tax=Pedobacter sp. ok626 TaxID=1761882 RepID=UPI000883E1CF|nr:RagB/SusD family nutrient uptake outer membrane protein [Pedobacter sp. ok626]SDL65067.1 SusD family protein [Pedobacter sp. ok626]
MKRITYLIAGILLFTGCRKYVEIDQIGQRTLKYTKDYRALLDNNADLEGAFGLPIYSNDDTRILDASKQTSILDINQRAYTWQTQYWSDTQSDGDWEKMYKAIYICNNAIAGAMSSVDGTDALKKQLYAEALVHRAYNYWCLVNIYGKQYDPATAATDLGVPLLLSPDLYANLKRATVAAVYMQVINDLIEAIPALPNLPDYNTRPSKAAAYALLARTYLFTRDFTNAAKYADMALSLQSNLLDLRTYSTSITGFPRRLADPQIIFSKVNNGFYDGIELDADLLNILGTKDLRYKLFVKSGTGGDFSPAFTGFGYWRYKITGEGIYQGPSVPEVMLIKAECLARANNPSAAIGILNTLREKRFNAIDYTPLVSGTAEQALTSVVEEKRREFFGTGLRWFDQKRLNKDSAFQKNITRVFKSVTYTLEPNSTHYVFPIGTKYILLNPELEQNLY